jgi:hypothetical protein
VKTAVSFSDPGMVKFFRDNMAAMVEGGVELVFCNESEALEWGQCDDLEGAISGHPTGGETLRHHAGCRGRDDRGTARRCIGWPRSRLKR